MSRFAVLLVIMLFLVSGFAAQIRVDVGLVNFVATVTDNHDHYVTNLKLDDFVLEEDGQVQKVAHLTQTADVPLSIGVVIDTSGSMTPQFSASLRSLERFSERIHRDDDVFLMTFSDHPVLRLEFTSSRNRFSSALRSLRNPSGSTAFYDAVIDSLREADKGIHDTKAVLFLTDARDTSSETNFEEAGLAVRREDPLFYAIGTSRLTGPPGRLPSMPRQPRELVNMRVLDTLANLSGGRTWLLYRQDPLRQMDRILDDLAAELRNQYVIGFYPGHPIGDGKWHNVLIRTKNPRYRVRARRSYFGS